MNEVYEICHVNTEIRNSLTASDRRNALCRMLTCDDPATALWEAVDSRSMEKIVPEFRSLKMRQNPDCRHKDVLAHTIEVVAMTPSNLIIRLAAFFHDIGKPRTRRYTEGEVTFRHHEIVGSKITRKRLTELEFDEDIIEDVTELVRLSGRFKGYDSGWSDSAVRRYARDAGHLLGSLNQLVRADCTSRNPHKRVRLHELVDDLEHRIALLATADRKAAERPQIDGNAVMAHLGVGPGPHIGRALAWLLDVQKACGKLEIDDLHARLDLWWAENRAEFE